MNKLRLIIFLLVAISILLFLIMISFQNGISIWPINKIMRTVNNSIDITDDLENSSLDKHQSQNNKDNEDNSVDKNKQNQYDINGDNFLKCELSSQGNYSITGEHIIVNIQGKEVSFDFNKITIDGILHPDNLPSVTLKYNLLPKNPDNVIYSSIFIANDNKLYICE